MEIQLCTSFQNGLAMKKHIRQGEPSQMEKSEAWQTAIGLQAVDGLKTSKYLLDTAKEHIEGKINIFNYTKLRKNLVRAKLCSFLS